MAARINSKRNTSPQAPNVNSLHRSQILRDLQAMQAISRIFHYAGKFCCFWTEEPEAVAVGSFIFKLNRRS